MKRLFILFAAVLGLSAGVLTATQFGLFDASPEKEKPPAPSTSRTTTIIPKSTTTTTTQKAKLNYFKPYDQQDVSSQLEDNREPHYLATYKVTSDLVLKWKSYYRLGEASMTMKVDSGMYRYYAALGRYYYPHEYVNYLNDENNRTVMNSIAQGLTNYVEKYAGKGLSVVPEAVRFVQSIPYAYDKDTKSAEDYPRYPIETLTDNCGDCEDSSILLAGILRELGYDVCLLFYPSHTAVGLVDKTGMYKQTIPYNGKKYVYIETTGSRRIGEIPDDYKTLTPDVIILS